MEFKCNSCGNLFDESLGVCPACGTAVNRFGDAPDFSGTMTDTATAAEPQMPSTVEVQPTVEAQPQPEAQPAAEQTAHSAEPPQPEAPSYQHATYSYGAGQQPQANYGQQPSYQQNTGYQQPSYQNAGYQQPVGGYQGVAPEAKSKLAAGLLGIFLGWLGVHNFYLGYTGKAVGQLLLTILSCGTLSFVSAIWGLIEGILILTGSTITTDASGRPLGD